MAKGLGASLWAWLNKRDAIAYLSRTLEDERAKLAKAEADARAASASAAESAQREGEASRALAVANADRVELCKRLAAMVQSQSAMTARLIRAISSADDYLDLAESYAAENDALRRHIGNARNQLDAAA